MTPNDKDDELTRRVAAAYDDVLREPVPDRLTRLVAPPAAVVDLAAERARRAAPASQRVRGGWGWAQWGGIAASLAIGVVAGLLAGRGHGDALLAERDGRMVAAPALAQALDERLAAETAARVAVQLSFVDRDGRYCRTFSAQAVAGLACRDNGDWQVVATAQGATPAAAGMRQASTALPRPVLDAVDARIAGNTLDAAQERAARDRGWKR